MTSLTAEELIKINNLISNRLLLKTNNSVLKIINSCVTVEQIIVTRLWLHKVTKTQEDWLIFNIALTLKQQGLKSS